MTTKPAEAVTRCGLCGESLYDEEWFDDQDLGDTHTRCVEDLVGQWGDRYPREGE